MTISGSKILPDRKITPLQAIAIRKKDHILLDRTTSLQNIALRKGQKILPDRTISLQNIAIWKGRILAPEQKATSVENVGDA